MPKKRVNSRHNKRYWILFLLIGILIGLTGGIYYESKTIPKENNIETTNEVSFEGDHVATIKVPAVDDSGNGVATKLFVKAEPGTGRTLVDINSLLFWVDTQNSIRMAKLVAENITGLELDNYDITYGITANASLIGGESAGAALTMATIAALKGDKLRDDVMITGTVNHDGTIGPIGGVLEKAEAAKAVNATLFLVPLLQSHDITYEEKTHCEKFGFMEWCNTERIPRKVNIGDEAGIEVREVETIEEAYSYFVQEEDS